MNIKPYLEMIVQVYAKSSNRKPKEVKYFGAHDLILNLGRQYDDLHGIQKGRHDQQCYQNAVHLSHSSRMTYVEGLAMRSGLPIPVFHAWCVDESGKVHDPTWGNEGVEYYGVEMSNVQLAKILLITEVYGVFEEFMHYPKIEKILLGKKINANRK